jgi:RHS repeat-associated protein
VSKFRPTNDQEAQYWIGGRQGVWGMSDPWWNVHCLESGEQPWTCWSWADYNDSFTWWPVLWVPEDACGVKPTWCEWCGPPLCAGCPEGGWLPGEPDDGGSPDCLDTRQENRMVLVLNANDDPDVHGFADVGSNGLFHGLIVRGIDAGTTYNYQRLWAYEFRYDGGRERYLARRLNPANPDPTAPGGILDETWTDYNLDGSVYGDYQVAGGGTVTELQRYVPSLAQQSVAGAAEYFLGDQIGTTRFLTDESTPVAATNRRVYTAFGELVEMTGTGQTRYGYAGAWGYQEHDADGLGGPDNVLGSPPTGPAIGEVFPFLHVGWRYYDPSAGRFLQRDPIGLMGGWNVYQYVASMPTGTVDPDGLQIGPWPGPTVCPPYGHPSFSPVPPAPPVKVTGVVCVIVYPAGPNGSVGYVCVNRGCKNVPFFIDVVFFAFRENCAIPFAIFLEEEDWERLPNWNWGSDGSCPGCESEDEYWPWNEDVIFPGRLQASSPKNDERARLVWHRIEGDICIRGPHNPGRPIPSGGSDCFDGQSVPPPSAGSFYAL